MDSIIDDHTSSPLQSLNNPRIMEMNTLTKLPSESMVDGNNGISNNFNNNSHKRKEMKNSIHRKFKRHLKQSNGLRKQTNASLLSALMIKDNNNDNEQCAICLEDIHNNTLLLPCLHEFCQYCLFQWINVKLYCPVCRQTIRKIDFLRNNSNNNYGQVTIRKQSKIKENEYKDFLFQTPIMFKVGLNYLYEYFSNHANLKSITVNNDDCSKKFILHIDDFRRGLHNSCSAGIIYTFFRNMIYSYNLLPYREQPNDLHYQEMSAITFIERPDLLERIIQFAKFDLENLQKVQNFYIDNQIYDDIRDNLKIYNISSSEFRFNLRSLLEQYCPNCNDFSYKFFLELNHFARSVSILRDANEYIQNTLYLLPQKSIKSSPEVILLTDSDDSTDSDVQIIQNNDKDNSSSNKPHCINENNKRNDDSKIQSTPGPSGLKKPKIAMNDNNNFELKFTKNNSYSPSSTNNINDNDTNNNHIVVTNTRYIYTKADVREMRRIIRNAQNSEYFFRKLLLEIKKKFYNYDTILNTKYFQHLTDYFKDVLFSSKIYRSNKLNNLTSKRTLTIDEINQRLKIKNNSTAASVSTSTTTTTTATSSNISSSRSPIDSSSDSSSSDCQIILEQYENANLKQLNNQIIEHVLSPSHSLTNHLFMSPQSNRIRFQNHLYSDSD